ncbi:MAG: hypothetical protein WC121_03545 [Candidatus Kapaibacterium sp.]
MCKLYVIGTTQTKSRNATYGYVIVDEQTSIIYSKSNEISKTGGQVTKIRATTIAINEGLREVINKGYEFVEIITCEDFFKEMFKYGYLDLWERNGWKRSKKKKKLKNIDLNKDLLKLSKKINIFVMSIGFNKINDLENEMTKFKNISMGVKRYKKKGLSRSFKSAKRNRSNTQV